MNASFVHVSVSCMLSFVHMLPFAPASLCSRCRFLQVHGEVFDPEVDFFDREKVPPPPLLADASPISIQIVPLTQFFS
jgi:hypothetical protein